MDNWTLAILIKPFAMFFLTLFVLYPARYAVNRWMPDGKLKRLFLYRVN